MFLRYVVKWVNELSTLFANLYKQFVFKMSVLFDEDKFQTVSGRCNLDSPELSDHRMETSLLTVGNLVICP